MIRVLRPRKYHHTVIEQQPYPSPNVTKTSDSFLVPGDYEMVKNISLINKSGPKEILAL